LPFWTVITFRSRFTSPPLEVHDLIAPHSSPQCEIDQPQQHGVILNLVLQSLDFLRAQEPWMKALSPSHEFNLGCRVHCTPFFDQHIDDGICPIQNLEHFS
jgi:hypothetical protein